MTINDGVPDLRFGIVARADDRGIGNQTWDAYRYIAGASALVVDMGRWTHPGFDNHFERYNRPGDLFVRWGDDRTLPEMDVRDWLETVDVVYIVETAYDPNFYDWARAAGVVTVLHVNPELHDVEQANAADAVWLPTPWRERELRALHGDKVSVVPYPVPLDRWPLPTGLYESGPLRVLHVAGHAAMADRNGTRLVAAACNLLTAGDNIEVVVATQDESVPLGAGARQRSPVADYWRLYDDFHLLLMPRRFGGLCLPIQEAAGAGLGVVTLDPDPASWYPTLRVRASAISWFDCASGRVTIYSTEPDMLAGALRQIAGSGDLIRALQIRARFWAEAHSWASLIPLWADELQKAGSHA